MTKQKPLYATLPLKLRAKILYGFAEWKILDTDPICDWSGRCEYIHNMTTHLAQVSPLVENDLLHVRLMWKKDLECMWKDHSEALNSTGRDLLELEEIYGPIVARNLTAGEDRVKDCDGLEKMAPTVYPRFEHAERGLLVMTWWMDNLNSGVQGFEAWLNTIMSKNNLSEGGKEVVFELYLDGPEELQKMFQDETEKLKLERESYLDVLRWYACDCGMTFYRWGQDMDGEDSDS